MADETTPEELDFTFNIEGGDAMGYYTYEKPVETTNDTAEYIPTQDIGKYAPAADEPY